MGLRQLQPLHAFDNISQVIFGHISCTFLQLSGYACLHFGHLSKFALLTPTQVNHHRL